MVTHARLPLVFALVLVLAGAVIVAGCGDDTVAPSNPDASAAKDATTEGGDGGEASADRNDGGKDEGSTEAGSDGTLQDAGAQPDASAEGGDASVADSSQGSSDAGDGGGEDGGEAGSD